jgi:hypothetical protein
MLLTNVVETVKTPTLCPNTPPPPENCAVYEIIWKKFVQPGRPQMTIWRMCIASSIPKAKNTLSEYVILTALPLQQR